MKRVNIFYYSFTEQSRRIAEGIRDGMPADFTVQLVRIRTTDPDWQLEVPLQPFWRRFIATARATQVEAAIPVVTEPAEPPECDLAVVGGPTWWGHPSLPVSSFLRTEGARRALAGKPVALFAACRGVFRPNLDRMRELVERLGGFEVEREKFSFTGTVLATFLSFFSFLMTGQQRERWLGVKLPQYGCTPETLATTADYGRRIAAAADTPRPAPRVDPVAASPGLWRLFRTLFLGLALFDLVLAVAFIPFGDKVFAALGQPQFAEPRFFQMCVGLFLLQYVYIQYMAFLDPRSHSTCVTMTLLVRLTFPIFYASALVLWDGPWTLVHTLFAISAAADLATSAFILFAMRRFQLKLWGGDAEADRPAPDSPWLRRILLVLACAEFSISWNWILAPKLWMTLFEVPFSVDPFWTRSTGAFLTNIAVIQFLGFCDLNRYRTAAITSGLFRALWPALYWYWTAMGLGNIYFRIFIMFFSFFDLISCITIFTMLSRVVKRTPAEAGGASVTAIGKPASEDAKKAAAGSG